MTGRCLFSEGGGGKCLTCDEGKCKERWIGVHFLLPAVQGEITLISPEGGGGSVGLGGSCLPYEASLLITIHILYSTLY